MGKRPSAKPRASSKAPARIEIHVADALVALDRRALIADLAQTAPSLPQPTFPGDLQASGAARTFFAQLAGLRVKDTKVPDEFHAATSTEAEFEAAIDVAPGRVPSADLVGRVYDGNRVAQAAFALLPEAARSLGSLHVWVTRRLLATYAPDDKRYHARYAVFGYPTVFSVLGLGLAPAPSLEAALFARELARRGASAGEIEAELDAQYPEERVDIDDAPTVTAAVASTVMQAAAALAGQGPFCDDPPCRLFNAHRKADLRKSLIEGRLCRAHAALFA